MILQTIADKYLWFLVAILAINLYQRKAFPRSRNKRTATLIMAALAMVYQILIVIILSQGWPHWLAIFALLIPLALIIPLKTRLFLFRRTCVQCSAPLNWQTIVNYDDNLCPNCWNELHPVQETEPQEPASVDPSQATDVDQIDWDSWEPQEKAVLCYVFDGDQVLLIEKKSGFGKGKITAPGGHIEEGETASEAAIRELEEETHLIVSEVEYKGTVEFQFADGLSMRGHVFFAHSYTGEPTETDEARPFWAPVSDLPYDKMWADDTLWLPLALKGTKFTARFIFDGDDMLSHHIDLLDT